MRLNWRWLLPAVAAVLALLLVSFLFPGRRHVALDAFVLFLGALGLVMAVRATHGASPEIHRPTLDEELNDPLDVLPQRPVELERLEREVHLSLGSGFYLHHRLRPLLVEIATNRLLLRHGVDLERRPDEAEKIVGPQAWEWLRPDRKEPRDRWAQGPPIEDLSAVVTALERI
jgi:hypothetical protein